MPAGRARPPQSTASGLEWPRAIQCAPRAVAPMVRVLSCAHYGIRAGPVKIRCGMREIVGTVRQAFDLLNGRLRRRWLLQVPWALLSAALEMLATAGMLILIRLISDPAGAGRVASLRALRQWVAFEPGPGFNAAFAALVALSYLVIGGASCRVRAEV